MRTVLSQCGSVMSKVRRVKSDDKNEEKQEQDILAALHGYKRPAGMPDALAQMLENTIVKIYVSTPYQSTDRLLNFDNMREICLRTRELLLLEPCFVRVAPPLFIIGDVHGQLHDLLDILSFIGNPPKKRLLFLGDYVDRGDYSLETITMLLAFKLRFPKEIYLLRGNHETRCVNRQYGFYDECKKKFPKRGIELWTIFQHVFNCLPLAALVGSKIFCAHGGISEDLVSFRQFERVYRPTDICDIGLLCDLIWSDPAPEAVLYEPSPRGVSSIFGKQAVVNFCNKMNIDLICRAHQCVMLGGISNIQGQSIYKGASSVIQHQDGKAKRYLLHAGDSLQDWTMMSAQLNQRHRNFAMGLFVTYGKGPTPFHYGEFYCGELDNMAAVLYVSGYEFFADKKCLTLFSAPCYCGELDNMAAVLYVSGRLECRVLTFKKHTGYSTAILLPTVEGAGPDSKRGATPTPHPAKSPRSMQRSKESR